jgi:hypothetical protein
MADQHLSVREASYLDDLEYLIETIRGHRLSFTLFYSAVSHDVAELERVGFSFEKIRCVHFWVSEFARRPAGQLRQAQLQMGELFDRFLTPEEDNFLGCVITNIRLHRSKTLGIDDLVPPLFWRVLTKNIDAIQHCGHSVNQLVNPR